MKTIYLTLAVTAALAACTQGSNSFRAKALGTKNDKKNDTPPAEVKEGDATQQPAPVVAEPEKINWDDVPQISTPAVDTRSSTQIVCEEGPKVAKAAGKDDFRNIFAAICQDGEVTETFTRSIAEAYNGTTPPEVRLLSSSTDAMYVTRLLFIYTINVPLESPLEFSDLKIFDSLQSEPIVQTGSQLGLKVESRKGFPGKASVEEVVLQQRIELAAGAALYDVRRTELNNYLLVENNRDINLTTEHLLDPETNQHYHLARGVLVGIKSATSPGTTDLVYVTELEVKNRIDPVRLQKTILDLAKAIQVKIHERAAATPVE